MEAAVEEDGFVVGLAGAEAAVEDAQHLGAEFAVASEFFKRDRLKKD